MSLLENVSPVRENSVDYPVKQFANYSTMRTKIFVIASIAFLLLSAYLWKQLKRILPPQIPQQQLNASRGRITLGILLGRISDVPIPPTVIAKGKRLRATHYLPYEDGFLIWWDNKVLNKRGISFSRVTEKGNVTVKDCPEEFQKGIGVILHARAIAAVDLTTSRRQTPSSSSISS